MDSVRKLFRNKFVVAVLAMALVAITVFTFSDKSSSKDLTLTKFNSLVDNGKVKEAEFRQSSRLISGKATINGKLTKYKVTYIGDGEALTNRLAEKGVTVKAAPEGQSNLVSLFNMLFPLLLLLGIFLFVVNRVNGGGSKLMQFGRAKTRVMSKDQPQVLFKDVAGAQEAIADLEEIKDFLESPDRFLAMGAKIPKGVLLYGPPGTGKTLLARAVAGEAGVPFFSISGSDFVEMFVGVGASRVRDLFEQAKAAAPAIIFMDEIDAVGRHRGAGIGGGNDEREQTLNQLLVEMDGFDATTGVIMIAATNRPDVLDPALLRPGRFDRQIVVDKPDLEGRTRILEVHAKDKPLADDVRLDVLAKRTPGFTGADLANLLNEAALLAARFGLTNIEMKQMEEAIDRVIAGPERATRVMSDSEKKIIAFHEGGHAIVGHVLPDADPVHKVSIVARGRALGWTLALPSEDKYLHSRRELESQLAVLMGGRTAEELVFEEVTTGASNDIEKATSIARAMVTDYGMSEALGPLKLNERGSSDQFLGGGPSAASHSEAVSARIDSEVRAIVEAAHDEARRILTTHRDLLDRLADSLMDRETVDQIQFNQIVGEPPIWPPGAKTSA